MDIKRDILWRVYLSFLGIVLLGALFVSMGCCASALTRSQVAAAMISLLSGASIFCVGVLADRFPSQTTWKDSKASLEDADREPFGLAALVSLCRAN